MLRERIDEPWSRPKAPVHQVRALNLQTVAPPPPGYVAPPPQQPIALATAAPPPGPQAPAALPPIPQAPATLPQAPAGAQPLRAGQPMPPIRTTPLLQTNTPAYNFPGHVNVGSAVVSRRTPQQPRRLLPLLPADGAFTAWTRGLPGPLTPLDRTRLEYDLEMRREFLERLHLPNADEQLIISFLPDTYHSMHDAYFIVLVLYAFYNFPSRDALHCIQCYARHAPGRMRDIIIEILKLVFPNI